MFNIHYTYAYYVTYVRVYRCMCCIVYEIISDHH